MLDRDPDDRHDLARFVAAQDAGGTYAAALAELTAGRKRGHWIWFVLPQLVGLGHSPTAQLYGVRGLAEARAYLAHPVLGARLRESARALIALTEDDPERVLGATDARKLRSSMTLFAAADPDEPVFGEVLEKFFAGKADPVTTSRLEEER